MANYPTYATAGMSAVTATTNYTSSTSTVSVTYVIDMEAYLRDERASFLQRYRAWVEPWNAPQTGGEKGQP